MGKDLSELASYFKPQAELLLERAATEGLDPIVEDTGRTLDEQAVKLLHKVSWTQHSRHLPQPPEMLSEALDVVPRACLTLKYWGWNGTIANSHPHWGKLIAIGEEIGMKSGVHFPTPDPGHFEYNHNIIKV